MHRLTTSDSFMVQIHEIGHLTNLQEIEIIHSGLEKRERKVTEEVYMTTSESTNH